MLKLKKKKNHLKSPITILYEYHDVINKTFNKCHFKLKINIQNPKY